MAVLADGILPGRLGLYVAPWLMMLAAGLAALGIWLRAWRSAAALAVVATGLYVAIWPGMRTPTPLTGPERIKVLTLSNRLISHDMARTAAFLQANPADIMVLQEVHAPRQLAQLMADHHACADNNMLILSRWPLGPPRAESTARQLFCDAEIPTGPVLVGGVHLPKARLDPAHQNRGLARLLTALEEADRPVILAGDFNTTPLTKPYRQIRNLLDDAYATAGKGFGMTFPTTARPLLGLLGPFLRIDHIFYSPVFVATETEVLSDHPAGADHFPVRTILALKAD
ncbi:MAG: endonuclease/exonuclease/phosphatase family protein [Pseudomonadota bacterium]